jgi:hypothetical protein
LSHAPRSSKYCRFQSAATLRHIVSVVRNCMENLAAQKFADRRDRLQIAIANLKSSG